MTYLKVAICTAALALLASIFVAAIGVSSDYGGATASAISVNANDDDTATILDFDGDGTIGFGDFLIFAGVFGARQGDETYDGTYDLNGDGEIGFSDFVIFAQNFGKEAPSPVVAFVDPEIYNDNVFVLPVKEDLAAGGLPLREYAARFFRYFNDEFDFLVFIPSLRIDQLDSGAFVGAFYSRVRNDVQGIGLESFSNGDWGSSRKLQGVVFLSHGVVTEFSRGLWDSERLYTNLIEGPLLHELTHRWANFLDIVPRPYTVHWGFSSANGVLGGFDIAGLVDHGNGRYRSSSKFNPVGVYNKLLSPIELYLAGFIPPVEVPDLWVAEDAKPVAEDWGPLSDINENWVSWDFRSFSASQVRTYTIEDIIAKIGPRVPDYSQAQKDFRAAVILLITEEYPATRWVLENLSGDASLFSYAGEDEFDLWYNFYEATGGRATISMDGLSQFRRSAGASKPASSSFGTPPRPIVDHRDTGTGHVKAEIP